MSEPVFLCSAEDLAEGQYRELQVNHDSEPVWLIATRHNGQPRVWFNVCPHQGRQLNFAPNRFLTDKENRLVCVHHRSEEHTSELQSRFDLVCRLLLEKKK